MFSAGSTYETFVQRFKLIERCCVRSNRCTGVFRCQWFSCSEWNMTTDTKPIISDKQREKRLQNLIQNLPVFNLSQFTTVQHLSSCWTVMRRGSDVPAPSQWTVKTTHFHVFSWILQLLNTDHMFLLHNTVTLQQPLCLLVIFMQFEGSRPIMLCGRYEKMLSGSDDSDFGSKWKQEKI